MVAAVSAKGRTRPLASWLHPFLFLVQWIIRKRKICLHRKIGAREVERVLVILRHDEERCYLAPRLDKSTRRVSPYGTRAGSLCAQRV